MLFCYRETELTSNGSAQSTIHNFSEYCIELIVALSSTNATKISEQQAVPSNREQQNVNIAYSSCPAQLL